MMVDNNVNINQIARKWGVFMGCYYIFRFACIPLSIDIPGVSVLFALMFIASPFLSGFITMVMRERVLKGVMTFKQGWSFSFTLMFCGSLMEAMGEYIYFRFIDHGKLLEWYNLNLDEAEKNLGTFPMIEQLRAQVDVLSQLTPIQLTMSTFVNGLVWTFILATLIALLLNRKTPKVYK